MDGVTDSIISEPNLLEEIEATISLDQFFNYIEDQIAPKRKKKKNQGATNTMCHDKSGLEA